MNVSCLPNSNFSGEDCARSRSPATVQHAGGTPSRRCGAPDRQSPPFIPSPPVGCLHRLACRWTALGSAGNRRNARNLERCCVALRRNAAAGRRTLVASLEQHSRPAVRQQLCAAAPTGGRPRPRACCSAAEAREAAGRRSCNGGRVEEPFGWRGPCSGQLPVQWQRCDRHRF